MPVPCGRDLCPEMEQGKGVWCHLQALGPQMELTELDRGLVCRTLSLPRPGGSESRGRAEGEGQAGSPLNREPNVGLDPRTLGS